MTMMEQKGIHLRPVLQHVFLSDFAKKTCKQWCSTFHIGDFSPTKLLFFMPLIANMCTVAHIRKHTCTFTIKKQVKNNVRS